MFKGSKTSRSEAETEQLCWICLSYLLSIKYLSLYLCRMYLGAYYLLQRCHSMVLKLDCGNRQAVML